MNCEKCDCPLTLLRVSKTRFEKRALCARCRSEAMQSKPQRLMIEDMDLVKRISRSYYQQRDRRRQH